MADMDDRTDVEKLGEVIDGTKFTMFTTVAVDQGEKIDSGNR